MGCVLETILTGQATSLTHSLCWSLRQLQQQANFNQQRQDRRPSNRFLSILALLSTKVCLFVANTREVVRRRRPSSSPSGVPFPPPLLSCTHHSSTFPLHHTTLSYRIRRYKDCKFCKSQLPLYLERGTDAVQRWRR